MVIYSFNTGILMASDAAPFMANLLLYYYENKWLLDIKKRYLHKARLFSNTFRFIDNLRVTNHHLELDRNFKSTYISELKFKKGKV